MTDFCFECAERLLGPAAMAKARRSAAEAPPLRPEQLEHLRMLFASALALPSNTRESRGKTCAHGEPAKE